MTYNKMSPTLPCIVENFWCNPDTEYKHQMLIIFLELNYGIKTDEPYHYCSYFTTENIKRFLQCF
jgi:hypothetical protein